MTNSNERDQIGPDRIEIVRRLGQSRGEAFNGQYSEALEGFLHYVDHGKEGIRREHALIAIVKLSEHLPEARAELIQRRDAHETAILGGTGTWSDVDALNSFNWHLGEKERTVFVLDHLMGADDELRRLGERLRDLIWADLANRKRYDLLETSIERHAERVASDIAFHYARWQSAAPGFMRNAIMRSLRHRLALAILAYQSLLALGKDEAAKRLAEYVTSCEALPEAKLRFTEAAHGSRQAATPSD